jgi:pilus assembly protein Flp/PilA
LIRDESGGTAIEYALIGSLISVAAIAGMTSIGSSVSTKFSTVSSDLTAAGR